MKRIVVLAVSLTTLALFSLHAQEPTKMDLKHYKVAFENDQVQMLHISYGPGERSVAQQHSNSLAIVLIDAHGNFTVPSGKVVKSSNKAGNLLWDPAGMHRPKNIDNAPFEL